ncbi:MAG: class I SAM-dependent methyltransferase [Chloroflexaceae bacterium]|nr:class I SAM-dependent methyltransferase [Chloroflexaceae bacterium]
MKAAGTFVHTDNGNRQFYRTKCDALDRVIKATGTTLQHKVVLDAAGGTGRYVPYFLKRGVDHITVADFSRKALEAAQQEYADNPRVDTMFSDLKDAQQPWQRSYDFAFVMEAIFLLPAEANLEQAIVNMHNALNLGGFLVLSDVFPTETLHQNEYIVRRSRDTFERILAERGFGVVGYVRQSFLFERQVFRRFQPYIENTGSLFYWLNRTAMHMRMRPPQDSLSDVKYLIARKVARA